MQATPQNTNGCCHGHAPTVQDQAESGAGKPGSDIPPACGLPKKPKQPLEISRSTKISVPTPPRSGRGRSVIWALGCRAYENEGFGVHEQCMNFFGKSSGTKGLAL